MFEGIAELLVSLFLIALILVMGSCIVGSIVAALRAVSQRSVPTNTSVLGRMQKRWNTVAQLHRQQLGPKIVACGPIIVGSIVDGPGSTMDR
jgi:hypothetical protein